MYHVDEFRAVKALGNNIISKQKKSKLLKLDFLKSTPQKSKKQKPS